MHHFYRATASLRALLVSCAIRQVTSTFADQLQVQTFYNRYFYAYLPQIQLHCEYYAVVCSIFSSALFVLRLHKRISYRTADLSQSLRNISKTVAIEVLQVADTTLEYRHDIHENAFPLGRS